MNILFDYNFDPRNGISAIESITEVKYDIIGEFQFNENLLVIPIHIIRTDWKLLVYNYDPYEKKISFAQMLDVPDECNNTIIHSAISTNFIVALNNDTHKCHVYIHGDTTAWEYSYSIDAEYSATTTAEDAGSVRVADTTLIIADWTITGGTGGKGLVVEYRYAVDEFVEFVWHSLFFLGGAKYGYSIDLKACSSYSMLIIGDPLYDWEGKLPVDSGIITIDVYVDGIIEHTDEFYGTNINDTYGNSVSLFIDPAVALPLEEKFLLLVGAEGYNTNVGRVYSYSGTINDLILATLTEATIDPAIPLPDLYFGDLVSCFSISNILIFADNIATGYLAEYEYTAGWNYTTPAFANPYTISGLNYLSALDTYSFFDYADGLDAIVQLDSVPPGGKIYFNFLAGTLIIKNVANSSFYASVISNNTISLTLGFSIIGKYRVILEMENNIYTIDSHNDTIYFTINDYIVLDNYSHYQVEMEHKNYTEAELAIEAEARINEVLLYALGGASIIIEYNAFINKYSARINYFGDIEASRLVLTFGSTSSTSYLNSAQDVVMGFYTNDGTILANSFVADREADLSTPSSLGIDIKEAVPVFPQRSANSASEVFIVANKSGGNYKILESDMQEIRFTERTGTITLLFKNIFNGAPLNINTNQISGRLIAI